MDALVAGSEDRGGLSGHVSHAAVNLNLGHVRYGVLLEAKRRECLELNSDIDAHDGGLGRGDHRSVRGKWGNAHSAGERGFMTRRVGWGRWQGEGMQRRTHSFGGVMIASARVIHEPGSWHGDLSPHFRRETHGDESQGGQERNRVGWGHRWHGIRF